MTAAPKETATRGLEALRISRAIEALRRKDFDKAEAQLQQAIAEDPQSGRLRFELGLVYFEWSDAKSRDHDGAAESAFARAAELDPTSDQALVYLGQVQLRRNLWADAHRSFSEALTRNPHARGASEGLAILGTLRVRQTLKRSLTGFVAAALVLGPVLWFGALGGSPGTAAAAPHASPPTVVSAAPVAPAAMAKQAVEPAPAALAVTPTVSTAPTADATDAARAPPPAMAPQKPEATEPVAQARRSTAPRTQKPAAPPANGATTLVRQGDAALRAGKVDDAMAFFNKALAQDSRFAPAHRGLGSVLVMQGKDAEALAAYRKYLSLAPSASDAARIRALVAGME